MTEPERPAETLPEEVARAMDDVRIASSADVPLFSVAEYEDRWDKLAAAILAYAAQREAVVAEKIHRWFYNRPGASYIATIHDLDKCYAELFPDLPALAQRKVDGRALASAEPSETTPTTGATDAAQ